MVPAEERSYKLKVGLVDVDGHNFPNLALMKISSYHKAAGDHVEWWNPMLEYDRVYMSKVFTFSEDIQYPINAPEVIRGGTGYKDYGSLSEDIDSMDPDYSIYPEHMIRSAGKWQPYAIGFLTRGCIRSCPWCIVPQKEGLIRPYRTWEQVKRPGIRNIVFMDNNVLACDYGTEQIEKLGHEQVWIDFNQGLDARLVTPENAKLLSLCHWIRYVRLSCDTADMLPIVEQAANYMLEAGISKSRFYSYVLVTDIEDAHWRVMELDRMGITAFAQPYRDYDGGEPTEDQKRFAGWVNRRWAFKSCEFKDFSYDNRKKYREGSKDEQNKDRVG